MHEVEHICAGIRLKRTAVDVCKAAGVLVLIPCEAGARVDRDLDDRVSRVGGRAVSLERAAVRHKGALRTHTHDRAENGLRDHCLLALFQAEQVGELVDQREAAVHDLTDLVLIRRGLDDVVLRFCKLGVLIVLRVFIGGGLVFRFLIAGLFAVCDLVVLRLFLFADGLVAALLRGRGILLRLGARDVHVGIVRAVARRNGGCTVLAVVLAGIALLLCLLLDRLLQHGIDIAVGALCRIDAGGIFRNGNAQRDDRADDGLQLFHCEVALDMRFRSARLEGSAVNDEVAVIDAEHIAGRVVVDVVGKGTHRIGSEFDRAGAAAAVALTAPFRGVDDRQRRAVGDLKRSAVQHCCIVLLIAVAAVVDIAVKPDLKRVAVQVKHLVGLDLHRLPVAPRVNLVGVIVIQRDILDVRVGQCIAERIFDGVFVLPVGADGFRLVVIRVGIPALDVCPAQLSVMRFQEIGNIAAVAVHTDLLLRKGAQCGLRGVAGVVIPVDRQIGAVGRCGLQRDHSPGGGKHRGGHQCGEKSCQLSHNHSPSFTELGTI